MADRSFALIILNHFSFGKKVGSCSVMGCQLALTFQSKVPTFGSTAKNLDYIVMSSICPTILLCPDCPCWWRHLHLSDPASYSIDILYSPRDEQNQCYEDTLYHIVPVISKTKCNGENVIFSHFYALPHWRISNSTQSLFPFCGRRKTEERWRLIDSYVECHSCMME